MTQATPEILTRDQVAAWLQVKPRQIERMGVPAITLGRKTIRYARSDVLQWLEAQKPAGARLRVARKRSA